MASKVHLIQGVAFKPAATASLFGMMTWLCIGTSDLEEILVGGKSFAASSDPSQIFSGPLSQGKKVLFGVPVYDGTIGLGYRLPLQDGMTHSPLIFLRYIFTVQTIQVFSVLISMVFSLWFANKSIISWTENNQKHLKLWQFLIFDIALLGPSLSYLLIAEWSTQAVQYFGAVMLISGLAHFDWYKNSSASPLQSKTILISISFGLSFFLVGHPGNLPAYFFVIASIGVNAVFRNFRLAKSRLQIGLLLLLTAVIILPSVLDIYIEGKNQQGLRISAKSWYEIGVNLRVFKQILVGSLWPLISPIFGNSDLMVKSGYEGFLGLIGAIGLFVCASCLGRSNPAKKLLIGICIATAIGIIQMLNPNDMGVLQPSSLWQVRDPIVASGVIAIAIAFTTFDKSIKFPSMVGTIKKILFVAIALNFAYVPVLIYSHFVGEGNQKYGYINQISQPSGKWKTILNASGVRAGERIYLADPTLFREADWHGYRNFSEFSAINVASINSWPKIRDARTLNSRNHGGATKFLNIVDSSLGCKPVEIGFFSVSHVLVRNNECKEEYDIVFGEGGYIRKALQNPNNWKPEDQVWLYSIKNFSSVYLISEYKNGSVKCSMLSSLRCIPKLGLSSSDRQLKSPSFELCVSGCLANVVIPRQEVGAKIALPIDFDNTVQVKSDSTGAYLKTFSYHGLLGVFIDSGFNEDQRLLVSIKPDFRMILNALSAWVHLILLSALLVFGYRLPRHSKKQ